MSGKVSPATLPPPYAKRPQQLAGRWHDGPFWFDAVEARRAIQFIELLEHTQGDHWAGRRLRLRPWERDIIRAVFGWKRPDGSRRYRIVYLEVPRKNGKSTLSAAIALKLTYADDELGGEIYSCAAERKQAGIVFEQARQMILHNPELRQASQIFRSSIYVPETGTGYHVLSADAESKHGFNPSGVIFDELHVQPNRKLWDAMRTSLGARRQPLLWAITTAGWDRNSLCYEIHKRAIEVRDGLNDRDDFLPVIFAAAPEDDWTDPKIWRKANPNLGVSLHLDTFREEFEEARRDPEAENTFKRLHLNLWTEQSVRWMPMHEWDACASPVGSLAGLECFAGLDLASTTDMAAFALLFPPAGDVDTFRVLVFYFCPEEQIQDRSQRDLLPYRSWRAAGVLVPTPGNVIDYEFIRAHIRREAERYHIRAMACDPWNATHMMTLLGQDGFEVVQFRQGFVSMNEPTKRLKTLALARKLAHGGHPILRWNAANVAVKTDPAGNEKPDKEKSQEKIDGIVALIMALGLWIKESSGSVYDRRGAIVL